MHKAEPCSDRRTVRATNQPPNQQPLHVALHRSRTHSARQSFLMLVTCSLHHLNTLVSLAVWHAGLAYCGVRCHGRSRCHEGGV